MSDKITVTTKNSYWNRLKNSFSKIIIWLVLVIACIFLLARNEHNFIEQKKALKEWAEVVQETTSEEINPNLEWAEIHLNGNTASEAEDLIDSIFWVSTNNLKLKRNVEMYQWFEEESETCSDNIWWSETCETTYSYGKTWSNDVIDSSNFYQTEWHENPWYMKYENEERAKAPITLWAYTLDDIFVNNLDNYKVINLSENEVKAPAWYFVLNKTVSTTIEENNNEESWNDTIDEVEANNNAYLNWESTNNISNANFYIYDKYIYIWGNPDEPKIWDLKITFSSVKPWTISIVWMQYEDTITSYTTSNWRSIALLEEGKVSAENMFIKAENANKAMTWILRVIWLLLMFAWFSMMFEFIGTLAKVLPFLSNIIWVWTGILAFCLTLVVWFLTIWIARLVVRPIVGIICLVIVVFWIYLLKSTKKKNKNKKDESNWKSVEIIDTDWSNIIEC